MATTMYLADAVASDSTPPGDLGGLGADLLLRLTRDAVATTAAASSTVAGPTSGVQIGNTQRRWWSNPLTGVTISGTITFNVWMSESNMSANVGAQVIIERYDGAGSFISTIVNSEKGTELPVTTRAAQNWTASPTSTTLASGDRLRLTVWGNDVGTMGSGFTFDLFAGAASGGVDGDSFVTFTETITEYVASGSLLIPHRHRGLIVR